MGLILQSIWMVAIAELAFKDANFVYKEIKTALDW
jgi:hypothetical protein